MFNKKEYQDMQNSSVLSSWFLYCSVLTFIYGAEYLLSLRTLKYFIVFLLFLWIPMLTCQIVYLRDIKHSRYLKSVIATGYLITYSFCLFTARTFVTFIIILPLISALVVYDDSKLIRNVYGLSIVLDMLSILKNVIRRGITNDDILFYCIQIGSMFLTMLFLIKAISVIRLSYEKMLKVSEEIEIDELTGLNNRHFLRELNQSISWSVQANVSVAVIDIDNFKRFNDSYGHNFGDLVLKRIGKVIKDCCEGYKTAHAIRVGGDEFLAFASGLTYEEMTEVCNNICSEVSELKLKYNDEEVTINVSIGLANTIISKCDNYSDLYLEADSNLYKAKNNGKNTVVFMESDSLL